MRFFIIAASLIAGYVIWRISLMKLKAGASLENVSWRMFWASIIWEGIAESYGQEAVITAGSDGKHSLLSKHYAENNPSGMVEAIDVRTWHIPVDEAASKLRAKLGPDYDVVIESTHIHIEYDPKGTA